MKTRIQFPTNGEGFHAAFDYKEKHGGRVVRQEEEKFGLPWLKAVYHYSYEHTPSEIFSDLRGSCEIIDSLFTVGV